MKKILVISCTIFLASCLKLDNNLYNNDNTIKEYKLDNYTGEQDFVLDASYDIPASLVTLMTLDSKGFNENSSTAIKAIYIGDVSRIGKDTVILYCHGNKWHMDFYWQRAKLLAHVNGKNRYGVMMMDYRGFGMSEGQSTEEGLNADVDACVQWLKSKGLTDDRFMMYGFSMGSSPATELTAHPRTLRPSKFILEAPIGSVENMANDGSQLNMPGSYFTDLKVDNGERIRDVKQPFLWMHGLNDNFLNYKTQGEYIYNNYNGVYKEKLMVPGADHGEVPEKAPFDAYLQTIGKFIRR